MMSPVLTNDEAERQLVAAAERHREALASMQQLGRSETGQHVAVKGVDRAVRLVCFALKNAAEAGIATERLAELTAWDPGLVTEGLTKPDDPRFVASLVPPDLDESFAVETAAAVRATTRLHDLTQEILAGVLEDEGWAPSADELDELHDRLATEWTGWRAARRSDVGVTDPTDTERP
jgi:hypothetical protein